MKISKNIAKAGIVTSIILSGLGISNAFAQTINDRVSGNSCVAAPSGIGYRPSLFECNGNAAILLRGDKFRSAFSVVVRRANAQFNDRDPANPSCGTNACSPYKTQETQNYGPMQVRCLGGSGFSEKFNTVTRISVKYTAGIENSLDPNQFQQYCIPNVRRAFN